MFSPTGKQLYRFSTRKFTIPMKQLLVKGCLVALLMLLAFMAGRQSAWTDILQRKISGYTSKLKTERKHLSMLLKPELGRLFDLTDGRSQMQRKVTVLVFSKEESPQCLSVRIDSILTQYPGIKTIVTSSAAYNNPKPDRANVQYSKGIPSEGEALGKMTSMVDTEYFLYMAPGVHLPVQNSDNSVTWLLHALLNVTELDFVGGSYLRDVPGVKYPVLEVPCHRLRLCNWTMSQSFEYKYSIGDMMVCEETSPSFMGRTSSLSKVGPFDSNLPTMATTDFFLRGKGKILTGLRPEVRFLVSEICFPAPMSATQEANIKLPLMSKYQLYVLKDSFGREVQAFDSVDFPSLHSYGITWWLRGAYASPLYIRGLQFCMELVANFFESQNITYYLEAGVALGGLKMRRILPWDRDVDIHFFGDAKRLKPKLEKYIADRELNVDVQLWHEDTYDQCLHVEDGHTAYADLYDIPEKSADSTQLIYIYIHGRRYPVVASMMAYLRQHYGHAYMEMQGEFGRQICSLPDGHHACLPEEYSIGGGHWRDFYCEL